MSENGIATSTVGQLVERLASDAPTPGGGAVAGLGGALGAGLIAMVARLTLDRKGFEDVRARMRELVEQADAARASFLDLADRDATAFDGVMEAFRLPKDTDQQRAERSEAIQRGYEQAAQVPLEVARAAVDLMPLAGDVTASGNPQAASDGASGAAQLYSAALCAICNVEINAAGMKDEAAAQRMREEVASLRARAEQSLREALTAFQLRISS